MRAWTRRKIYVHVCFDVQLRTIDYAVVLSDEHTHLVYSDDNKFEEIN